MDWFEWLGIGLAAWFVLSVALALGLAAWLESVSGEMNATFDLFAAAGADTSPSQALQPASDH